MEWASARPALAAQAPFSSAAKGWYQIVDCRRAAIRGHQFLLLRANSAQPSSSTYPHEAGAVLLSGCQCSCILRKHDVAQELVESGAELERALAVSHLLRRRYSSSQMPRGTRTAKPGAIANAKAYYSGAPATRISFFHLCHELHHLLPVESLYLKFVKVKLPFLCSYDRQAHSGIRSSLQSAGKRARPKTIAAGAMAALRRVELKNKSEHKYRLLVVCELHQEHRANPV